jgi:uncharacterized membrane protein YfcA
MALWGIAFGVAATITGAFVLGAIEGGFLAEGFFLVVIFWVFLMVLVAKIANRLKKE